MKSDDAKKSDAEKKIEDATKSDEEKKLDDVTKKSGTEITAMIEIMKIETETIAVITEIGETIEIVEMIETMTATDTVATSRYVKH